MTSIYDAPLPRLKLSYKQILGNYIQANPAVWNMPDTQLRKVLEYQLKLNIPYFSDLTPNGKLGVGKAVDQAVSYINSKRKHLQVEGERLCVA